MSTYRSLVVVGALLLLAAAPRPDSDALLKEGHAAFARGDWAAAADWYEKASVRATDPGKAALSLAAAKYHLASETEGPSPALQEAESLYRCCLGAEDPRRPSALYGLGNCLLRRARDPVTLREAVACYDLCLKAGAEELAADARHNCERARLLLLQLVPAPGDSSEDRPPGNDTGSPPPGPDRQPAGTDLTPGDLGPDGRPDAKGGSPTKADPGQAPIPHDGTPPPGAGNLPPIPDQAEVAPLAVRDAAEHLERAQQRITREHRDHRRGKVRTPAENVPAW